MTNDADERRLVTEAAGGSRAAGEELFARHWPAAWRLAYSVTGSRSTADDVAQDAFERAFRRLASFDGRSSFRTWLFRIVLNRAVDLRRRERRSESLDAAGGGDVARDDEPVEDRAVLDAVRALPVERRTVVALRYWGSLTPAEIAST